MTATTCIAVIEDEAPIRRGVVDVLRASGYAVAEAADGARGLEEANRPGVHLVLLDVRPFGITGRQAESALRQAQITVNRNSIPFDPNGAWYTSGVRLGTPATTTLGMGPDEMDEIASIITELLAAVTPNQTKDGKTSLAQFSVDDKVRDAVGERVNDLLASHPLYPSLKF